MPDLPSPVTREDRYTRGACDRLDTAIGLLGQILDRLTAPEPEARAGGKVELREPAAQPAADGQDPPAAELTEPAASATAPRPGRRTRKTTKGAT